MVVRIAARPLPTLLLATLCAIALVSCTTSDPVDDRLRGDAELIDEIDATYADDFERAAVAVVAGDEVRTAYVAADETTMFEVGSITKVLTGELFAIAIDRGEVTPDDRLGDHLDLADAPAASVTLLQLATHSSGLPTFPDDPDWMAEFDARYAAHEDPVDEELDEMLALARTATVTPDAGFVYSNFGAALLGQALASAAGVDYPQLLRERVLDPIGMDDAVIVETPDQVPENHAGGFSPSGDAVEPWSIGPYSPAGGVDATLDDVVALARAVLDGELEDSAALDPVAEVEPNTMIGYFWFVDEVRPRTITGHGGRTGGFGTALLINREAGTASIVLANTESDPYALGLRLLIAADR
jgi:CubicO group peptidase (beta-lactamase class C family)